MIAEWAEAPELVINGKGEHREGVPVADLYGGCERLEVYSLYEGVVIDIPLVVPVYEPVPERRQVDDRGKGRRNGCGGDHCPINALAGRLRSPRLSMAASGASTAAVAAAVVFAHADEKAAVRAFFGGAHKERAACRAEPLPHALFGLFYFRVRLLPELFYFQSGITRGFLVNKDTEAALARVRGRTEDLRVKARAPQSPGDLVGPVIGTFLYADEGRVSRRGLPGRRPSHHLRVYQLGFAFVALRCHAGKELCPAFRANFYLFVHKDFLYNNYSGLFQPRQKRT